MLISYETFAKAGQYFIITFSKDMEDGELVIKFKPNEVNNMIFSKDYIDLSSIKMRDVETVLSIFGEYGITLIIKGIK